MPIDSYTKVLLHMNGVDGSAVFTDVAGKTWTAHGSPQIDTAQSKFGGAAGLFPGTSYIDTPDHADFFFDDGSTAGDWAIDFWFRYTGSPAYMIAMGQYQSYGNVSYIYASPTQVVASSYKGSTEVFTVFVPSLFGWSPAADTWHHFALAKAGIYYRPFLNGVKLGDFEGSEAMANLTGVYKIGRMTNQVDATLDMTGWLDEVRFSKGTPRWTADFTPPVRAYGGFQSRPMIWSPR